MVIEPPSSRHTAYVDDSQLPAVTDDELKGWLASAKSFTAVILKHGPRYSRQDPEVAALIFTHGKRNFALQKAGLLPMICPIADDSAIAGLGILVATPDQAEQIFSGDPAVLAGVLTFEIHHTVSLPGSTLPDPTA